MDSGSGRMTLSTTRPMLSNNIIVSFPRSGQHLLERLIRDVYVYYDLVDSTHKWRDTYYCKFWKCCNQVPCKSGKTFMKNHDENLELEVVEEYKYVILYREDEIRQLESWFRWTYDSGDELGFRDNEKDYNLADPKLVQELCEYAHTHENYYREFKKKWIYTVRNNCLSIEYYDFIKHPKDNLLKILRFFNHRDNFEEHEILKILDDRDEKIFIRSKNHLDKIMYNKLKKQFKGTK